MQEMGQLNNDQKYLLVRGVHGDVYIHRSLRWLKAFCHQQRSSWYRYEDSKVLNIS